jgi:hypothetical protein
MLVMGGLLAACEGLFIHVVTRICCRRQQILVTTKTFASCRRQRGFKNCLFHRPLAFYGQLGFATTYQDEGFAIIKRDGINLHLNSSPEPPKGHSVCWIDVTNIEALYQQYLPTNAVQSPLEARPWGLKEFFICDPFRNLILFAESISEEEASAAKADPHPG